MIRHMVKFIINTSLLGFTSTILFNIQFFPLKSTNMSDNLRLIQYNFPKISEKKKRKANPFFLFRNNMKETAPNNIKMTELSKIASDSWKKLSEEEKTRWKRSYEINRDL